MSRAKRGSNTVCDKNWSIPDPVRRAQDLSDPVDAYRAARDTLRVRVEGLLGEMPALVRAGAANA